MFKKQESSLGFTIVELLIVIVVIGVLAAITIVAFSGIQNRARASSASSALSQAAKKIAVWRVDSGTVSPTCAEFNTLLNSSGSSCSFTLSPVAYQYTAGTSGAYCITATDGTISYKITESSQPTAGGCAGHGAGGVAAVTNLAVNPSAEVNATSWGVYTGLAAPTRAITTPWSGVGRISAVGNNTSLTPRTLLSVPAASGDVFSASVRVRSDGQTPQSGYLGFKTMLGGGEVGTLTGIAPSWAPDGAGWMLVSASATVPASCGCDNIIVTPGVQTTINYTGTLGVDGLIVVRGSTIPNYADGSSVNWIWNGTANNSTSTGPPQ